MDSETGILQDGNHFLARTVAQAPGFQAPMLEFLTPSTQHDFRELSGVSPVVVAKGSLLELPHYLV